MKKFIVKTIAFLIFTAVIYTLSLFIWEASVPLIFKPNISYNQGSYGHVHTRLSEVKTYTNVDILFLGSSHAYRGFDTRLFSKHGYKTFNLGSSAQTPIQTKVLLDRYLEQLNPRTIIYEVYPPTLTLDGVESSLDIIANDRNSWSSLKMSFEINNVKTYNTLLYGFTRDLFGLNTSFLEPLKVNEDSYVSGGFVEKEIRYFEPTSFEKKEIDLNSEQVELFSDIVSIIGNKEIDLILVYAPIPNVNYNSYNNTDYFDSLMNNYSEYYNFNEILSLNDSLHFYDADHLNQKGVELFNKKLINILNKRQSTNNK
jgi:hypothetical protein